MGFLPKLPRGFTLIELLIVVAIIAILTAIGVPQFMEAQTRSKVARAKSDMHSLANALESYAVDHNKYPIPGDSTGATIIVNDNTAVSQGSGSVEWDKTRLPNILTTPIVYISSLPDDAFLKTGTDVSLRFRYTSRDYAQIVDGDLVRYEMATQQLFPESTQIFGYYMGSIGPDGDMDQGPLVGATQPASNTGGLAMGAIYDPTNGSLSSGDILYLEGYGFPE